MRLLLVSLLVAGSALTSGAQASDQPFVQHNVPVRDVTQACKLYSALGLAASKDCETCEMVVMTGEGVRMTLWPDIEGAGIQPRHLEVVAPSLPTPSALEALGAAAAPSTRSPGCVTVTDADGYQVDVCS